MDDLPRPPEPPSTLNRREMLRKSAFVGGGLVWGVPLIQSVRFDGVVGSRPPEANTCCTCNCSSGVANGRVVLQSCNLGVGSSSGCQALCDTFCRDASDGDGELTSEQVDFADCGALIPTCAPTKVQGATGTACICGD